jgi:hypothetical protein
MMASAPRCHVLASGAANDLRARAAPDEIRAFARCRNERLRLPAFLKHYRELGVDRFFFVDNDSSDGSTEYLADQTDVHLFRTADRYREASSGTAWLNALLAQFGIGFWCVTVDIDELLIYPGSEETSLRRLTKYLDQNHVQALSCMLLDLYPPGPLNESAYAAGDELLAASPYFDAGPYETLPFDACPAVHIRGGMRERVFYPEFKAHRLTARIYERLFHRVALRIPVLRDTAWLAARRPPTPPLLAKIPLVRWDEKSKYLKSNHRITPKPIAPETGVLLHFKFLSDFHARAVHEAARGEYSAGAYDYRRYAERLSRNPNMSFMYDGSIRFEGTSQLVHLGLMQDTGAWRAYRVTGTT